MKLNENDVKRFYFIWLNLLDYTNEKYKIDPSLKDLAHSSSINVELLLPIKDRLWEDNSILDEVVATNPKKFDEADLAIVASWRNRVSDTFFLLRHLKNYSILLNGRAAYGVIGLNSSFEDLFPSFIFKLPIMIEAVLLPFEGKIIHDSLLRRLPISVGGGTKRSVNEQYREFKAESGVITTLE